MTTLKAGDEVWAAYEAALAEADAIYRDEWRAAQREPAFAAACSAAQAADRKRITAWQAARDRRIEALAEVARTFTETTEG